VFEKIVKPEKNRVVSGSLGYYIARSVLNYLGLLVLLGEGKYDRVNTSLGWQRQ
jgi:hypothetical protein